MGNPPARLGAVLAAATLLLGGTLVLHAARDALAQVGRTSLGFMSNGVVGRDALLRVGDELRPYDHVRRLARGDEDGLEREVQDARLLPGEAVALVVAREGSLETIRLVPRTWTRAGVARGFLPSFLAGVLLLAATFVLSMRARALPAVGPVILLTATLGIHQLTAFDVNWVHRFERLHIAALSLLPFVLMHVALAFPAPVAGLQEEPSRVSPLYVFAAVVAGMEQMLFPSFEERWILLLRIKELFALVAGLGVAGRLIVELRSPGSPSARYRTRIAAYGACVAFGLPALCFLVDMTAPSNLAGAVLPFAWSAVPLSLGFAVGRPDLLEVDDRYRRTLIPAGTTAVCLVALFLIQVGLFRSFGVVRPLESPAFVLTFLVILAVSLEATRRIALVGIERIAPSPEARFRRFLGQATRARGLGEKPAGLAEFVCRFVRAELHPRFAAVVTTDPESGRLRVLRSAGELPPALSALELAASSTPARRLLRERTVLSGPDLSEAERQDWHAAGLDDVEVSVPLPQAGHIQAALLLGSRASPYSPGDLDLLGLLAQSAALGLAEAHRLDEAERTLRERSLDLVTALESLRREGAGQGLPEDESRFAWIGKLASGIAHEANKPLYVIEHHLRRLLRDGAPPERRLRAMETEVSELRRLFGDLQAYAGSRRGARQRVTLQEVIDEALGRAPEDLRITLHGAVECEARVDPSLLARLLGILLENARQAGAAAASVEVGRSHGTLRLRVSDDGPGVPAGLEERIFEPFFGTRAAGSASGLGLAIAREIATAHGGTLRLVPSEAGASFVLDLPQA
jgi:signal transduction histidine kinase